MKCTAGFFSHCKWCQNTVAIVLISLFLICSKHVRIIMVWESLTFCAMTVNDVSNDIMLNSTNFFKVGLVLLGISLKQTPFVKYQTEIKACRHNEALLPNKSNEWVSWLVESAALWHVRHVSDQQGTTKGKTQGIEFGINWCHSGRNEALNKKSTQQQEVYSGLLW